MWNDWKYLLAYLAPLAAFFGMSQGGIFSPAAIYVAFVIIPVLEFFSPVDPANLDEKEELRRVQKPLFNLMLYFNVVIVYGLTAFFIYTFLTKNNSLAETIGMTLSLGVVFGTSGINVAHELGHRHSALERLLAKMLLLPILYSHFTLEHNLGHHKYVSTPEDPATARLGESLYSFWFRSVTGVYIKAWKINQRLLRDQNLTFWSQKNGMFWSHLVQLTYLIVMYLIGGPVLVLWLVLAAVAGFLLLETVNYIEHYGLVRRKLPSGKYEKVETHHSWNSNHEVGRIVLYELTRHADHHYKSTRPYQVLRHWDESPQLPYGYPMSMLIALIPPLWFKMMNPLVRKVEAKNNGL